MTPREGLGFLWFLLKDFVIVLYFWFVVWCIGYAVWHH